MLLRSGIELAPPILSLSFGLQKMKNEGIKVYFTFKLLQSSHLPSLAMTSINKHDKLGLEIICACWHIGDDECYYIKCYHFFDLHWMCMHKHLNNSCNNYKNVLVIPWQLWMQIPVDPSRWCEDMAMWDNVSNLPKLEVAMLGWQHAWI